MSKQGPYTAREDDYVYDWPDAGFLNGPGIDHRVFPTYAEAVAHLKTANAAYAAGRASMQDQVQKLVRALERARGDLCWQANAGKLLSAKTISETVAEIDMVTGTADTQ